MAAQADGLLVHGHLVGEDGGLGEDAPLVDGGGGQHLPHFLLQPLPIGGHGLDGVLSKDVGTGHFHRAVQEAVVDRPHLHGNVPLVQSLSGPAIAGHAFDQCKLLLSMVRQQQKKYPPLPNRQFIQAQAAHRLLQLSPAQLPVVTCP